MHVLTPPQGTSVAEALGTFEPYRAARSISVFLSMPGSEIQTDAIVRDALAAGKDVYVPYLHRSSIPPADGGPARVMDMVRLRDVADYETLKPDRWGIPSVDPDTVHERRRILDDGPNAPAVESTLLDLILMPGVAFDLQRGAVRRLGHGKGFYDFFIHRYLVKATEAAKHSDPLLYGLALKEQLLDGSSGQQVPVGPLDQGLHGLVLGDGTIVTSRSDGEA
jgi:5-formyltetrahydrofolate cyclo-ligase